MKYFCAWLFHLPYQKTKHISLLTYNFYRATVSLQTNLSPRRETMVSCNKCSARAIWRITTQTPGFGGGRGGAQCFVYACSDHREHVRDGVEEEIKEAERSAGNPFYPEVAILKFGVVQVLPFTA